MTSAGDRVKKTQTTYTTKMHFKGSNPNIAYFNLTLRPSQTIDEQKS